MVELNARDDFDGDDGCHCAHAAGARQARRRCVSAATVIARFWA
jgi:hypothetical protein